MTDHNSSGDLARQLFETTADKINAALATGAMLMPWWHPFVKELSDTAAIWTPILGGVWVSIQIGSWTVGRIVAIVAWWRKF